jgi:hypothetical protein
MLTVTELMVGNSSKCNLDRNRSLSLRDPRTFSVSSSRDALSLSLHILSTLYSSKFNPIHASHRNTMCGGSSWSIPFDHVIPVTPLSPCVDMDGSRTEEMSRIII